MEDFDEEEVELEDELEDVNDELDDEYVNDEYELSSVSGIMKKVKSAQKLIPAGCPKHGLQKSFVYVQNSGKKMKNFTLFFRS